MSDKPAHLDGACIMTPGIAIEHTRGWRDAVRQQDDVITALRSELAAYRAQPFVPLVEHDRVREQRDAALLLIDAMTREVANLRDTQRAVSASRLTQALAALVRQLEKISGYSTYEQQAEVREARALIAEVGR